MSVWRWLLCAVGLAGCRVGGDPAPVRVLTTFQPLYSLTHALAEDTSVEVRNLAPADVGPHDYDPARSPWAEDFRQAAQQSDALVTLGSLSLAEPFDRLYAEARAHNIRLVELDPARDWLSRHGGLALLPEPFDPTVGGKSGEPAFNPHVWLSLSHMALMAPRLAAELAQLAPAEREIIQRNTTCLVEDLNALRGEYLERLAQVSVAEVVALTEGFPYLTADLGIAVVDYLLVEDDAEAVARRVRASGARVVLAEEEPQPSWRQALERDGATLVVLDTLEEGRAGEGSLDPSGYRAGMRDNLERLVRALEQADPER